jgi:ABC-type nickel/cobalt efflux system permease component RcnA
MINKIMTFVLKVLAIPIAAIAFAYAGFLLLFSGGQSSARSKAKTIFLNTAIGLIIIAGCWLIISTILSILGYDGAWIGF